MSNKLSPDEILHQIQQSEETSGRGHVKIFFGYAAGVGKTYAMLEAAHVAKNQGVDVVCGYIEPHTRPQTLALLEGLVSIPTREVMHKGLMLHELDIDRVLERKPQLVLVDEFAHTNAPGSRHEKRYQDVEELLNHGMDVYTTVNVQHIESLCDIVASITGIIVHERIPDKVFDSADQVELVDIEPHDLMARLKEGKVYRPNQAERALDNFFTDDKLTALREIALRRSADRVNRLSEKKKRMVGGEYYTEENILVGLSSSPSNEKIIRSAARMANAFQGSFTALFVETSGFMKMTEESRKRLRSNVHLAQQLGAKIETVYGEDVAFQIAEYARVSSVSKIVVGRSNTRRRFSLSRAVFSDRLSAFAPNLDIYIIPDRNVPHVVEKLRSGVSEKITGKDALKSLGILTAATLCGFLFYRFGFSEANIITVYILGVLFTSLVTSHRLFSLVSSVLSVVAFNFFFTDPRFSLSADRADYPVTFVIMFIAAFLTSSLTLKIQRQMRRAAQTAYSTKILLETNQLLQKTKDEPSIWEITAKQLKKLLKHDIVMYRAQDGEIAEPHLFTVVEGGDTARYLTQNEKAVAAWVLKNNKRAGASTTTLGSAQCLYLAVRSGEAVFGVVGVALERGEELEAFQNNLALSVLSECAASLEKETFRRKREEAQISAQKEQLRANLLRSISHDLRTPLTSISGNAGVLLNSSLPKETQQRLFMDIYDDSMWLINLVENLLAVTRIEDGSMSIQTQAELLEEIVAEALKHVNRKSVEHTISVHLSDDLQFVKVDAHLIIQLVINLVDNAIKYTQDGSRIVISSQVEDKMVAISVADDGPGIPNESKPYIFDMFYTKTASGRTADSHRGMGLGLALCKSIVEVHGGAIAVYDNVPRGAIFQFTLPCEEVLVNGNK